MKRVLIVVLEQDTEASPNPNGNAFVVGRLRVTNICRANWLQRIWVRAHRRKSIDDIRHLPDTGLSIGVQITTDQYAQLMGMVDGRTHAINVDPSSQEYASMDFVQAPKPNQMVGRPVIV